MSHATDGNDVFGRGLTRRLDQQRERDPGINVGSGERIVSAVLGGGLALFGLGRRSLPGLLLAGFGAMLIRRGMTGKCETYRAMGVRGDDATLGSHPLNRMLHAERSITINKTPLEVYRAWHEFDPIGEAIPRVTRVTKLSGDRTQWVVEGPRQREYQWFARVTEDRPGESIAWETLPGSDIENHGRVTFRAAPGGRGTEVRLAVDYRLPMGVIGAAAAKLTGASPFSQIEEGLRRFRQLLEAGEMASPEGPSGRAPDLRPAMRDAGSMLTSGSSRSGRGAHWPREAEDIADESLGSHRARGAASEPSPLPPAGSDDVGGF